MACTCNLNLNYKHLVAKLAQTHSLLATLLGSSSRMVTLQTLSAMLLPHAPMQETADMSSCDEGQEKEKGPLVPNVAWDDE